VALQRQFFAYNQFAERVREDLFQACGMDQLDLQNERYARLAAPMVQIEDWVPRGWITGYGFGGSIAGDANADGCSYGGGGVQAAFGYQATDQVGLGLFYDFGSFDLKSDFGDKANAQAYSFGGYLAWHRDCDYFMFVGGGGFANYGATRYIDFESPENAIATTAQGKACGGQAAFYGEYGRNVQWENAHLRPYLGLLYMTVQQNAFKETGAGTLDLSFQDSTVNSFRTLLGSQFDYRYAPMANLVWSFRSVWMHECINDAAAGPLTAGLSAIPNGGFLLARPDIGRDWYVLGCGVRGAFFSKHLRPFADYDLIINGRQALNAGVGGLEYVW